MDSFPEAEKTRCSLLILLATQAEEDGLIAAAQSRVVDFEKLSNPNLGKYLWFGPIGPETVIASRP